MGGGEKNLAPTRKRPFPSAGNCKKLHGTRLPAAGNCMFLTLAIPGNFAQVVRRSIATGHQ
jgi:hypothetical protein